MSQRMAPPTPPRCDSRGFFMLTQERLKELLKYDSNTGIFTWIKASQGIKASSQAGCKANGYILIGIDYQLYQAHRLAWLYIYGSLPKKQIDHINHNRADNRIINLREVTHQENTKNAPKRKTNTSGVTGVSWDKDTNKWRSQITINGKATYLGIFSDKLDAICARKSAENKNGFHKNHGI